MPNVITSRHDIIPLDQVERYMPDAAKPPPSDSGSGSGSGSGSDAGDSDHPAHAEFFRRKRAHEAPKTAKSRALAVLYTVFPILSWLPEYETKSLINDIVAGLTVGVMVVPQSMAYAAIAETSSEYGLYSSLMPIIVYLFMGSSKHLAVGPTAIVALLTHSAVTPIVHFDDNPAQYISITIVLAFLSGVIQVGLGMLRMGFLVNLLSHPVVAGFTSGAAIIIGSSQLRHLFRVEVEGENQAYEVWYKIAEQLGDTHGLTLILGLVWLFMLLGSKTLGKRYKQFRHLRTLGPLVVVTIATLVTYLARLDKEGLLIIENVPSGLPAPEFPDFSDVPSSKMWGLVSAALGMSLVGFMESISVAQSLAIKHGYEVDANQELMALGFANLFGALFLSFPITGSFSRSAICSASGGKTSLHNLFTAGVVALTLVALTPLFFYLPKNVLAGIVMSAVVGLIDTTEAKFLWRNNKREFCLFMFTLVMTLIVGAELGILLSVGLSLILVIHESARPHYALLGKTKDGKAVFRSVKRYPDAEVTPHVVHVRVDAPLYFANVGFVKELLVKLETAQAVPVYIVIVDASPITSVDSTAIHALFEIVAEYERREIALYFANVNDRVRLAFDKSGLGDKLTDACFFDSNIEAVAKAKAFLASRNHLEEDAPADTTVRISRSCSTDSLVKHVEMQRMGVDMYPDSSV